LINANLELPRPLIRELAKIRQNTAAYIGGFICRKILPPNCLDCRSALLGENITDIHAYIILKDLGNKLMYPSEQFIAEIIYKKKKSLKQFHNLFIKIY
jgi:hypothetical protein